MRYGVQGDGSALAVNVSGGATTETTISGLDSSANYSIEVAAVNNAGIGAYSRPVNQLTQRKCYLVK